MVIIGRRKILDAELWAIYTGVKLARRLEIKRILIESDTLTSVELLTSHPTPNIPRDCLLKNTFQISHIGIDKNLVADELERQSHFITQNYVNLIRPLEFVFQLLQDDFVYAYVDGLKPN